MFFSPRSPPWRIKSDTLREKNRNTGNDAKKMLAFFLDVCYGKPKRRIQLNRTRRKHGARFASRAAHRRSDEDAGKARGQGGLNGVLRAVILVE